MKMLASVLVLITIVGIGFVVNYYLQDVSAFVILKNILVFYVIGCIIIEGLILGRKEEIKSQGGQVDTDRQNKN